MSEKLTLSCGCVVEHGYPLSRRIAVSRCETGKHLWQRYVRLHSDTMYCGAALARTTSARLQLGYEECETGERQALERYQEHIEDIELDGDGFAV